MSQLTSRTFLAALSVAVLAPHFAHAASGLSDQKFRANGSANLTSRGTGQNCNLIDFEGGGCNTPIGVVPGAVTVTFGASWLSLVDFDAGTGCNGNFANEPSASTAGYFLDTNDISIGLNPPVRFVEFFYSASAQSLPVVVTAFDAANNVVDVQTGNVIGTDGDGADCVGDPSGNFCNWGTITLTAASDVITRVTITGTVANQFGIDNLQFCTDAVDLSACCLPRGNCSMLSAAGCEAAGGTSYPGLVCDQAPCDVVPVAPGTWGRLKNLYRD